MDVADNLYIADSFNNRIRKVDSTGTITTIAGTGEYGFGGDGGPAAEAQLSFPFGVAVDVAGNLYIADRDNQRIRKLTPGGSGSFTDAQHEGTALSATLTGLSPDTVYEVQVRASTATGTGEWSESGEGKTSPLPTGDQIYYFPHLAVGASWQTTITYINYSSEEVTCQTDFLSDDGTPLMVSFAGRGAVPSRTDILLPGGSVHQETNVALSAPLARGWARATCSGPVKASLLFRQHSSEGAPVAEAGVNAATVPATRFVTFAEQGEGQFGTGVAYANPSATAALVTFTARDTAGEVLPSVNRTLSPGGHAAHGMSELFDLTSFTGSIEVTSTEPIVSLSLNFEADPVFSSLPPGELDASAQGSTTYYFPHLAVGASWQTTITYINYSSEEVTCQTDFLSDDGTPLMVSFAGRGAVPSRTDILLPGGSVHQETNVDLSAPLAPGWARATCSGPVKASLLYRQHSSAGVPTAEAGVNAAAVPATRFVTFAEQGAGQFGTGVAYANPSATVARVTFTARDAAGQVLASVDRMLSPGGHGAHGMLDLFGLPSFTGSLEITSTEPIVSLSINFEADPVFSSLPPGDLDAAPAIPGEMPAPDLVVQIPFAPVSDSAPAAGANFTLSVTVRNVGDEEAAATTLRYYRSNDTTISSSDTPVGRVAVSALPASGTSAESIPLTAPSSAGTYYYGACVDPVSGESDTGNNCSSAVRVTVSASQIGSAGFDLASENGSPEGIVFANNRFYVVDKFDDKVYAYTASGQRDSASDFDLDSDNSWPRGITFANNRFYVVDFLDEKVYAYTASGQRDSVSDFDLDSDNDWPGGITFANNRFSVVDKFGDKKVYAYQAAGQRDSASDFDLDSANRSAEGITFANNRFYVVDDREGRVYAYDASGQRASAFDLYLDPANGDASGIEFANDRFYVVDDDREDRVYAYSAGAAPGTTDSQPSFGTATVSNRTYTAGAAISVLTLPAASGGDGTLTYSLSPAVAGLSFNATTRVLSGTPTTVSSYGMTYTARDADGDIATLRFTITVAGSGSFAPADEQSLNRLVVGNRLHAVGFYIDFPSAGRFLESGSLPGSYSYASTGSDTGTMTLTYDGGNLGGSCTLLLTFVSATTGTLSYTCASGIQGQSSWTITAIDVPPLGFSEGESATRGIWENTPPGINVGGPVSAVGGDSLTYTISGTDSESFVILPETGQIRTREGVTYDYETKNRYFVTVGVEDDSGNRDTIDVTIRIVNLAPACEPPSNFRVNYSDERLTLRWSPLSDMIGHARVLGYETEIRRGTSGAWSDRRTFLGRNIGSMIYAGLDNEIGYQVRVRPINAEGDCQWSTPVSGIPTADFAPKDPEGPIDRFGPHPVGTPERNFRFLTPGRCRHTSNGQTLDADCEYENTGPDSGRIFLEFDDPSQGSCEITLAYSSLTAGSFIDECFDAGVNTNVPFDREFRMPRSAPRNEDDLDPPLDETDVPRAPRTQEEFDALVYGRDDFIPGLCFGSCIFGDPPEKGVARVFQFDDDGVGESYGDYTYEKTGPSQGVVTLTMRGGGVWTFTLDFEPWGNVRATIVDSEGGTAVWPGTPYVDLSLGAQPVLLPIPPSWSSAIAIQTDVAPEDWEDWYQDWYLRHSLPSDWEPVLFGTVIVYDRLVAGPSGGLKFLQGSRYEKIGRNRATITVTFEKTRADQDDDYENLDEFQRGIFDSTWVFDLTFTSDGAARFTLTVTREGYLPTVVEGFVDFHGDGISVDEFPEELLLPDEPPQASGEDVSGVEVATAITASSIEPDDQQVLLVSAAGGNYQPGDWLEPKDGGNQRMMIVGAGQVSAARRGEPSPAAPAQFHPQILKSQATVSAHSSPNFAEAVALLGRKAGSPVYSNSNSAITRLSVVCMQMVHDIPTRGARYFSVPKTAQNDVQGCQRNCVLEETKNIQLCVWKCEASPEGR